jgi:hypothetical protein
VILEQKKIANGEDGYGWAFIEIHLIKQVYLTHCIPHAHDFIPSATSFRRILGCMGYRAREYTRARVDPEVLVVKAVDVASFALIEWFQESTRLTVGRYRNRLGILGRTV